MNSNNFYSVASAQVSYLPVGLLKVEGAFLGTTADRYLQVHNSCNTPAAGAVPLKQWPIAQNSPFYFELKRGELRCSEGCFIAVSTSSGTYTASADTMDVNVETIDPVVSGLTKSGDRTTDQGSAVTLWNEATGAGGTKRLIRMIISETFGEQSWLYVAAKLSGSDRRAVFTAELAANETKTFEFGLDFLPKQTDADGTQHMGCQVGISTTNSQDVTALEAGFGQFRILAITK